MDRAARMEHTCNLLDVFAIFLITILHRYKSSRSYWYRWMELHSNLLIQGH